jgi:dihydroneopterin aldolase
MAAEEEAAAGPGGDKLILRGLQFHGFHGVKQEEQTLGQKFVVDIDAWMDLTAAGESDSIAHTVSYTDIYGLGSLSQSHGRTASFLLVIPHRIRALTMVSSVLLPNWPEHTATN